jgi:DNA/RNA-binding domain of Phe-tRNA-synthetase-like protein
VQVFLSRLNAGQRPNKTDNQKGHSVMDNTSYRFIIEQGNIDFGVVNTTVAVIENVQIPSVYDHFVEATRQSAEASAISNSSFQQNPILAGYRGLYQKLGYKARDIIPAAEGLLRLIRKRGSMPRINPAVDLYNTVVVERMLGIGAHDLATIRWPVTFTRAAAEQSFVPIGRVPDKVRAGDFLYKDADKVLCRLAAHDCDEAKLTPASTGIILVSEGNPATTVGFVRNSVEEACRRIVSVCGGRYDIYHPEVIA